MGKGNRGPKGKRFGIGEWFGKAFAELTPDERDRCIAAAKNPARDRAPYCPYKPAVNGIYPLCPKQDGVCTVQLYIRDKDQPTAVVPGEEGRLRCTCPWRFHEDGIVNRWIGEELLIEAEACEVIFQAVEFSGPDIFEDYSAFTYPFLQGIPFPAKIRWPDYRRSGPEHLLPRLGDGPKAVVIDESFFAELGEMEEAEDRSKAAVAWFVVGFDHEDGLHRLKPRFVRYTTLEQAVAGLTAVKEHDQEIAAEPSPL